jgi:cytochrome b subunit of formate dehydrogenase
MQDMNRIIRKSLTISLFLLLVGLSAGFLIAQEDLQEEYEAITSEDCTTCHEKSRLESDFLEDLSRSVHEGMECLDCHNDKGTIPHKEADEFEAGYQGCAACHEDAFEEYTVHGRKPHIEDEEIPSCSDCHGSHTVLPSSAELSKTHPVNLPNTCGVCHRDLDLIARHEIPTGHPIETYESSIHGMSVKAGDLGAATCNDCHSTRGTAHKIYAVDNPDSTISHFNIPTTCGQCHEEITDRYWKGIHGQLAARGNVDSPVCTHCHGEHGIISPTDPRSPVSRARLAEATCTPCHESISLTEKYGISTGRRPTFIDNFHGLKTQAGDVFVANCGSCHGYHLILPSSDPESSVFPDNLQRTCGECHPGITADLAAQPIHGPEITGEFNPVADIVRAVYIIAIIVIIGMMALHWLIDLFRQILERLREKPQVVRMRTDEVWQHTLLMVSFIVLVITGFALRYGDSWYASLLFGWDHGFEVRGIIHRVAAVVMMIGSVWHLFFLFTGRGRRFLKDMFPNISDFLHFFQRVMFNLRLRKSPPRPKRFSYVEKAEYWALVWGNTVMIGTGLFLWFDNYFLKYLQNKGMEVARVIHFYEAILATLAILIWHMYSTVFNPEVYPMNPSWLTGKMPRAMFEHEHPEAEIEEVE